jgi:glycyl-tRNA synthetase beta chain
MSAPLLVELFTEELPPKALRALGEAFAAGIAGGLQRRGLAAPGAAGQAFATPRRLAVLVPRVLPRAPDTPRRDKVLPVSVALDAAGQPTPTLAKKLAALGAAGVALEQLERASDGKQDSLFWNHVAPGMTLAQGLQEALADAVAALPIPKVMRYQSASGEDVSFVRPAHGLVALHGAEVVPVRALGLAAGRRTHGHRFMGTPVFHLDHAGGYERQLLEQGMVIAAFDARSAAIAQALAEAAAHHQAALAEAEDLIDEVTALVEFPTVYAGSFDSAFLAVPQECLILSMKRHQKYFPLVDAAGRLLPRFLIVSNLRAEDPRNIIHGNERVLRARLADARFFFDQDRRQTLAERVEKLGAVVYHNKLGSQLERVRRLTRLAGGIARLLHADAALAERAARLAKADLVTDMVGEFPELQGIMGMHYARHDGEDDAVAAAIEAHYHPRFAADSLPAGNTGAAVALADKLDTLTGIYGIGLVPSGDKDPFGLRRAALGVLRILVEGELPLDLLHLLRQARAGFDTDAVSDSVASDLHGFMLERLRGLLRERGVEAAVADAVIAQSPVRMDRVLPRAAAVRAFLELPEAAALAAANKRIRNILRKSVTAPGEPDLALMVEPAEKALLEVVLALAPRVASLVDNDDYTEALRLLAGARPAVDRFFDEVMVMAEDESTRRNRLGLLARLDGLLNAVADISRLAA